MEHLYFHNSFYKSRLDLQPESWCKFQENQSISLLEKWVELKVGIGRESRSREAECLFLCLCTFATLLNLTGWEKEEILSSVSL